MLVFSTHLIDAFASPIYTLVAQAWQLGPQV